MQPRFAALLFALGLVDLAYVNLGLGSEVFAEASVPSADVQAPRPIAAPVPLEARPEPPEPPAPPASQPSSDPAPAAELPATDAPEPALAPSHAGAARGLTEAALPAAAPEPQPEPLPQPEPEPTDLVASLPASDLTITFPDTATAGLTARAREELLALAARLRDHPEYRIHIVGHADARGSREFNLNLGGRRARAVSELLTRAGVSREQLEALSRGEDEPRAIGAGERAWAANRRVEITIGSERSETP